MVGPVSYQLDVYGVWIHLATTPKQWKQIGKRLGLNVGKLVEPIPLGRTLIFNSEGVHAVVFIDVARLNKQAIVETCAHEATHVAGMVYDEIGAKVRGDDEHMAYLVGWATAWLWANARA